MTKTADKAYDGLLDEATRLRKTNPRRALGLFHTLSEQQSQHQIYAEQQYGISLAEVGMLDDADRVLQAVLKKTAQSGSFKGYTLIHLAEIAVAFGRYDQAQKFIDEGMKIFEEQHDFFNIGRLRQLEGTLEVRQGASQAALEKILSGSSMVETYGTPTSSESNPLSALSTGVSS